MPGSYAVYSLCIFSVNMNCVGYCKSESKASILIKFTCRFGCYSEY